MSRKMYLLKGEVIKSEEKQKGYLTMQVHANLNSVNVRKLLTHWLLLFPQKLSGSSP